MRKHLKRTALFFPLVFVIISCVTINVYFPAAAVEKAADKIVDDVWGGGDTETPVEEPKAAPAEGRLESHRTFSWFSIGTPAAEAAADADINVSTPAIRTLKQSIQRRAASIKPYMNKGNIGIGKDGLLVLRSRSGLNLKEKAQLNRLVKAENRDRMALYREIAKANNITPDRVGDIKGLFAKSWIKNARKGWKIQAPDGSWRVK